MVWCLDGGIVVDGVVDVLLFSLCVKSASLLGIVSETTNYRITRISVLS